MNKWLMIAMNVVLLGLVLAAIPLLMRTRQPYEQNNQGIEALSGKRYDEAITLFKGAFERKPKNVDFKHNLLAAYNSKAISLSRDGKTSEALEFYEQALTLSPGDQVLLRNYISAVNNLAVDISNSRDFLQSQKLFERASTALPRLTDTAVRKEIRDNYSALLTLWGTELMKRNQVAEAKIAFSQALDLDTGNAIAHVSLGDLGYESNDYPLARKHYSAALPLDKENADYLTNRIQMIEDESKVEGRFKQERDSHQRFLVQYVEYNGGTPIREVLSILNDAYETLGKDLGIYPARTVNVKIYTADDFARIAKLPEWAIGIFDGKMRLKVDEVQSAPSQVRDLLFHEYTHAVLAMNVKQTVPAWFHEGIAQLNEPQFKESAREQEQMREALARNQVSFEKLQESFKDIENQSAAENAYLLSKYFLAYLNRRYGHEKLTDWVKRMTGDEKFEVSFEGVYGLPLKEAQQAWIKLQAKDQKTPAKAG